MAVARTVLMLAFYFPPFAQSTGGQRVISFVRHLARHGWNPVVLTASERVFAEIDPRSLELIPPSTKIIRTPGLDVARDLSIGGRYPRWLALPDRWSTWGVSAWWRGMRLVRALRPEVLWVTFPIPSALLAAVVLHRLTGIPLVADLRDPIVYEDWPADRTLRCVYNWIERKVVKAAHTLVVTTPGARDLYLGRYPHLKPERVLVIANGVDEDSIFSTVRPEPSEGCITLLHSGLMEIPDRDPTALFIALAEMRRRGEIDSAKLQVVLRATGRDEAYRRKIEELGLQDVVRVASRLSHREAVSEMGSASGLLVFQGSACNRQIPAKAYEYLASQRPIVGFCDPRGDTYDMLARDWGVPYMANMADPQQIAAALNKFLSDVRGRIAYVPPARLIAHHARSNRAQELAALLDAIVLQTPSR